MNIVWDEVEERKTTKDRIEERHAKVLSQCCERAIA